MRVLQVALHLLEKVTEFVFVRGSAESEHKAILEAAADCTEASHCVPSIVVWMHVRSVCSAPALLLVDP